MSLSSYPVDGKFGKYGGRFVPEILMEAITELEKAYNKATRRPSFPESNSTTTSPNSSADLPRSTTPKTSPANSAEPKST